MSNVERTKWWCLVAGLVACGRTGLEAPSIDSSTVSAPEGGLPGVGGGSHSGGALGTAAVGNGGTRAGGAPGCPTVIPAQGLTCDSELSCSYVTVIKTCCEEHAVATCNGRSWKVSNSDCDCPETGGASSVGGAKTTGGASSVGGAKTTGGASSVGGAKTTGGANGSGGVTITGGSTNSLSVIGCSENSVVEVAKRCDRLVTAEPALVELDGAEPNESFALGLARANRSGSCVSVVTNRKQASAGTMELAGVSFEPWSPLRWPRSGRLGPLTTISLPTEPSGAFAVGSSGDLKLSLAWQAAAGGVNFGWDVDVSTFSGTYTPVQDAWRPSTVSTSAIGHLTTAIGRWYQSMQVWSGDGQSYTNFQGACADTDVIIGTEPYGKGFMWATSTGSSNLTSGCPAYGKSGGLGLPRRIDVGVISDICCASSVDNFDAGGTVVALKTAPHPQGIWVVWQTDAETSRVIHWRRYQLDPIRGTVSGTIGSSKDVPVGFAAASLGDRLVVAWSNAAVDPPVIMVSMVGGVQAPEYVQAKLTPPSLNHLSLIAGPGNAGLLLGFPNGYLTRLNCAEFE